jgi:hypothetical protein
MGESPLRPDLSVKAILSLPELAREVERTKRIL